MPFRTSTQEHEYYLELSSDNFLEVKSTFLECGAKSVNNFVSSSSYRSPTPKERQTKFLTEVIEAYKIDIVVSYLSRYDKKYKGATKDLVCALSSHQFKEWGETLHEVGFRLVYTQNNCYNGSEELRVFRLCVDVNSGEVVFPHSSS